jgi:hypothetical protein
MQGTNEKEIRLHEREAIWLQTDAGFDWRWDDEDARKPNPVYDGDIVEYLVHEYIYGEAENYTHVRIRAYIDRSDRSD